MNRNAFGTLYVVATPIGHLEDITQRALLTLKAVDGIAAEDTRHSALLLKQYGISTPLISLHQHNEKQRTNTLLDKLRAGASLALISDAGTPLISDPGSLLVAAVLQAGIQVVPVPGPCALIAALSVSGFPSDRFIFEGFLPAKSSQRVKVLKSLCHEPRTMVFYEAPHRIAATLEDMCTVFGGEREALVSREMTKLHESIRSGTLATLCAGVQADPNQQRGEQVVILRGAAVSEAPQPEVNPEMLLTLLLPLVSLKQAVDLTVKITGVRRNMVYQQALMLSK